MTQLNYTTSIEYKKKSKSEIHIYSSVANKIQNKKVKEVTS